MSSTSEIKLGELLTIDKVLGCPHLPAHHPLKHLLTTSLTNKGRLGVIDASQKAFWGPERFKLQNSSLFVSLGQETQTMILEHLSALNLSLSYFIEKSALQFAAKMILLSEFTEEKMFYAKLAAEETSHLHEFKKYLWFEPDLTTYDHPMLAPMAEAIQFGTRDALTFVIQVLLEGFGIAHYSGLRDTCLNESLKTTFQDILKDESLHHGAGLVLTKSRSLSAESREQIFELSRKFIRALESAHWVPSAFKRAGIDLTESQMHTLWEEIEFKKTLNLRMQKLREMFLKSNQSDIYDQLNENGVFGVHTL